MGCSTTDRQRAASRSASASVALGEHGEGPAAHAGDDVLTAHGGAQPAADLGHGRTVSRPAFSRAVARPSSSIISSVVGVSAAPATDRRRVCSKPARLGSPVIGSV